MPPRHRYAPLAAMVAAVAAVLSPSAALGQPPPYTMEERAAAIAAPSMVYLESWVTGYLRRNDTGEALKDTPFVLTYRCSGFAVSAQGHVASAGHCIAPDRSSLRGTAANILANERIKAGTLTAEQKDAFLKELTRTTQFTGENLVSAPTVKIYGQHFRGKGLLKSEPAWLADSIEVQSTSQGDVAVIKFGVTGLPAAEISPDPLTVTTPVVAIGFVGDSTFSTANFTVKSISAKVTGRYGNKTPELYQIDQDLGPAARGGMVADSNGRIVGLITADLSTKDRPNRVITNIDNIRAVLGGVSASNTLDPIDRTYRAGLDAYFGGRYAEAITKLDTVLSSMPQHELARNYRAQAAERLVIESQSGSSWLLWLIVVMAFLLVLCAVAIVWLVIQQRRRQRTALELYAPISSIPVSGYPVSGMPVSGMPVSGGGYEYQPQAPIHGLSVLAEQHADSSPPGSGDQNPWAGPPSASDTKDPA